MFGLAADILVPGMPVREVCRRVVALQLPFDQLIDEFETWVHISISHRNTRPRGHMLEARRGKSKGVIYTNTSFK